MKFRISTILVLTAFIALGLFGFVGVMEERAKQEMLFENLAVANEEIAELRQGIDSKIKEQAQQLSGLDRSFGLLSNAKPDSPAWLLWLDNRRYFRMGRKIHPEKEMTWRLFLPQDAPKIELCVALGEVPAKGLPVEFNRYPAGKLDLEKSEGTEGRWVSDKEWHGHLIIDFEVGSFENESNQGLKLACRTLEMEPKRPWEVRSHGVLDALHVLTKTEDMKWFAIALADFFDPQTAEMWNVEHYNREISFEKPVELFRIRGKRLVDGVFEKIDGPAPGMMAWLQLKSESDLDQDE